MADCHGSTHNVAVEKGLIESSGWWADGNKNAKADSIVDFLKQLGVTQALCHKGCEDKKEKCRPHTLRADDRNDGEKGAADSDLAIAEVKLHKQLYHKYVLHANKAGNVAITVGCTCMGPDD